MRESNAGYETDSFPCEKMSRKTTQLATWLRAELRLLTFSWFQVINQYKRLFCRDISKIKI